MRDLRVVALALRGVLDSAGVVVLEKEDREAFGDDDETDEAERIDVEGGAEGEFEAEENLRAVAGVPSRAGDAFAGESPSVARLSIRDPGRLRRRKLPSNELEATDPVESVD